MARNLPPATIELLAQRFRALSEPMRLRLMMALQDGERTVTELVDDHETSQANISKHLQVLTTAGLLKRRKQGLNVYYAIADPSIFNMCEMVCGSLKKHLDAQSRLLS
jgi:DNA-binding transcriptional ArsR family regulator